MGRVIRGKAKQLTMHSSEERRKHHLHVSHIQESRTGAIQSSRLRRARRVSINKLKI